MGRDQLLLQKIFGRLVFYRPYIGGLGIKVQLRDPNVLPIFKEMMCFGLRERGLRVAEWPRTFPSGDIRNVINVRFEILILAQ